MSQRHFDRFRIGDLIVDTGLLRVTRDGVDIALPKLSFDLLLALIRAAPNVLSNEELTRLVWPGLVVTPETVSQRVKLVRDALGDDPRSPRYIAGLRGRGYSILPPVTLLVDAVAPPVSEPLGARAPDDSSMTPRPTRRRKYWIGAALTIAASLATLRIFWPPAPHAAETPAANAAASPAARTVAVMPFQNLSIDPADRFLAPGISEMVNDRLARTGQLVVIARTSAAAAAERGFDAKATGALLGARYLVDGSVQRVGQQLRVTARLINCETGAQLWSERFDRKLEDLFHIQDEIAERIGTALETKVVYVSAQVGGIASSANIDAYLAYLEGRVLLRRWTAVSAEAAAKNFQRAIDLDPKFAAAYVAFAEAKMMAIGRQRDLDKDLPVMARKYAPLIDKALELDPTLGAGYVWRAVWLDEMPGQQAADFRHGLALDPNDGEGLTMYTSWLDHSGAEDPEIEASLERALLVDPLSPRAHYVRAQVLGASPVHREKLFIEALKVDPGFYPTLCKVGKFRATLHGEFAESIKLLERAIASDPPQAWARIYAMLVYLDIGDPDAALDVARPSAFATSNANFLLLLYQGKTREADLAIRDGIELHEDYVGEFGAQEAVRDAALQTRDYRHLIKIYEIDRRVAHPDEPWNIIGPTVRSYPAMAHAYRLTGHPDIADRILAATNQWLDANEARVGASFLRTRAAVYAMQGNREAALHALAASFRNGDRYRWWYTVTQDPIFEPLRADPAFQAIALEARQHAAKQRALLEDMRRRGEVPMRPAGH
jgi:TolB-like protein/DNA-binding winged helix-turn-helix (wHTH) protein